LNARVLKDNADWLPSTHAQPISKPVLGTVGTVSAWVPLGSNLWLEHAALFSSFISQKIFCFQSAD